MLGGAGLGARLGAGCHMYLFLSFLPQISQDPPPRSHVCVWLVWSWVLSLLLTNLSSGLLTSILAAAWGWNNWCPCSLQDPWTMWLLKVPLNPNHSEILWPPVLWSSRWIFLTGLGEPVLEQGENRHILPLCSLLPACSTSEICYFPDSVCSNTKPSLSFDPGLLEERHEAPVLAKQLWFCHAMWCACVQVDRGCKHPFPCRSWE